MSSRDRGRIAFALVAVLAILAVFVLHGAAGGAAAFAAMFGFIAACIYALQRRDADVRCAAETLAFVATQTGLASPAGSGAGSRAARRLTAASSQRQLVLARPGRFG